MLGMVIELIGPCQSLLSCSIFNLVASFQKPFLFHQGQKVFPTIQSLGLPIKWRLSTKESWFSDLEFLAA